MEEETQRNSTGVNHCVELKWTFLHELSGKKVLKYPVADK